MKIRGWLSGGVDDKARELVRQYSASFPSSLESSTSRKAQAIGQRAFLELIENAVGFQREQRMGVIRKVLFARAFQDEMRALGYSPSFIRQVTSEIVSKIAFAMQR